MGLVLSETLASLFDFPAKFGNLICEFLDPTKTLVTRVYRKFGPKVSKKNQSSLPGQKSGHLFIVALVRGALEN
jgi:hypothetical protein